MPSEPSPVPSFSSWIVPAAVLIAVILGAALGQSLAYSNNPSGVIQPVAVTPPPQQISTGSVVLVFGAPFAALAAAVVATAGVGRRRGWALAIAGVASGTAVFGVVGASAVSIGTWWLTSLGADTNRVAAIVSLLLAAPGTLALLLAARATPLVGLPGPRSHLGPLAVLGALVGLVLGGLIGIVGATVTWAATCPQTGYTNCFTLTNVESSAALVGGVAGLAVGSIGGVVGWILLALLSRSRSRANAASD